MIRPDGSHQAGIAYLLTRPDGRIAADADTLDGLHASAFALAGHNHDAAYAAASHTHDSRYYTESESDARFAPIAKGVTNGDAHNHSGGDGGTIDHGSLGGRGDDDHTQYLLASGARALSNNWDAGNYQVRARTFYADVATGTAPLTIASTTQVANLNADLLDGSHASAFAASGHNHDAAYHPLGGASSRSITASTVQAYSTLYTRANLQLLNKAATGWLTWASRYTGGSEAVYNLSNLGNIVCSGYIDAASYIDAGSQFLGNASDTAGAPSFSWTGDTNVGIFRPTTDTIGFSTAGSERGRITSGGNLLWGTTTDIGARAVVNGSIIVSAQTTPSTGKGASISYYADVAYYQGYDFGAGAWRPVKVRGSHFIGLSDSTSAPSDSTLINKEFCLYVGSDNGFYVKWKNTAGATKTYRLVGW